ncbi:MAG TPA: WG repeat-containing protein [Chryseosolibacter sp.]|nr:WG repeat-containing protein [Chryseosolibacter sp.]
MSRKSVLSLALIIAVVVAACSVLKKEDPDKAVRAFLVSFQNNLAKSDAEILKQFRVRQSPEAVLMVIRLLQNKEKYFRFDTQFSNAFVAIEDNDIRVTIPVKVTTVGLPNESTEDSWIEFSLKSENKSYVITKLSGESFYNTFTTLKNKNEWGIKGKTAVESRLPIYAKARELEAKFDTVIFFATYKHQNYFYVVEGEWNNYFLRYDRSTEKSGGAKMGLANSSGELIIPVEYDLIGTIAFERPDLVEVKKDGQVGYFDLSTQRLIIEPQYDMIIPTSFDSTFAIVTQDTVVGWITPYYEYRDGFPSEEAKEWFENYGYLRKSLRLGAGLQVFCEIPSEKSAGSGIVMPPSYLVHHSVFKEIEGGITTTEIPLYSYTDYKETKGSLLQRITDGLSALTTSIEERYLDGREEFYNTNTIVFVGGDHDTLAVSQLSGSEISMRVIDSTLLEVKTPHDWWFAEEGLSEETNLYFHTYFTIADYDSIRQLASHRRFPETEFVKLDSSYVTGQFLIYDYELDRTDTTTVLSLKTLTSMRDEILAWYGYSFPDVENRKRYDSQWYFPIYDDRSEFADIMTEIDRHNLEFLERFINASAQPEIEPVSADKVGAEGSI